MNERPKPREIARARKRAIDARDLYTAARNNNDFKAAQELLPLVWKFEEDADDLEGQTNTNDTREVSSTGSSRASVT
jgi:hypothetical protein